LTVFSLSRQELYDFSRCPKIVSIKSFRLLHPQMKEKPFARAEPEVSRSAIGKIGEAAVAAAFSHEAAEAVSIDELKEIIIGKTASTVTDLGVSLDGATKAILQETVQGLAEIRGYVSSEYGEVQVIGRGLCKNGPFPGEARPDFVALSPKRSQPILIEVKNTPNPMKTDRFQASYYNTVAREMGVVVHEERVEEGRLNLTPVAYHQSVADTILVYPRGRHFERVTDVLEIGEDTVKDVWRAKQLGFSGRSPHTDCDSKCPHRRLGVELPEGDLEAATPLPLIYAKGLTETEFDLDTDYLHNYYFKSGLSSGTFDTVFRARHDAKARHLVIEQVAAKTEMSLDVVRRMLYPDQRTPDSSEIMKAMSGELKPWTKILGGGDSSIVSYTKIQGLSTRFFTLPDESREFVKRAWRKWSK
jgi:hypothetical protein